MPRILDHNSQNLIQSRFNGLLWIKHYHYETTLPLEQVLRRLRSLNRVHRGTIEYRTMVWTRGMTDGSTDFKIEIRRGGKSRWWMSAIAFGNVQHDDDSGVTTIHGRARFGLLTGLGTVILAIYLLLVIAIAPQMFSREPDMLLLIVYTPVLAGLAIWWMVSYGDRSRLLTHIYEVGYDPIWRRYG